jgi:hypothetical protein
MEGKFLASQIQKPREFYGQLENGLYCGRCEKLISESEQLDNCPHCGGKFTGKKYNCTKPGCTYIKVFFLEVEGCSSANCHACGKQFDHYSESIFETSAFDVNPFLCQKHGVSGTKGKEITAPRTQRVLFS